MNARMAVHARGIQIWQGTVDDLPTFVFLVRKRGVTGFDVWQFDKETNEHLFVHRLNPAAGRAVASAIEELANADLGNPKDPQ